MSLLKQKHEQVGLEERVLALPSRLRLHRRQNRDQAVQQTIHQNRHLIPPLRQNIQNLHVIFLAIYYQIHLFLERFY